MGKKIYDKYQLKQDASIQKKNNSIFSSIRMIEDILKFTIDENEIIENVQQIIRGQNNNYQLKLIQNLIQIQDNLLKNKDESTKNIFSEFLKKLQIQFDKTEPYSYQNFVNVNNNYLETQQYYSTIADLQQLKQNFMRIKNKNAYKSQNQTLTLLQYISDISNDNEKFVNQSILQKQDNNTFLSQEITQSKYTRSNSQDSNFCTQKNKIIQTNVFSRWLRQRKIQNRLQKDQEYCKNTMQNILQNTKYRVENYIAQGGQGSVFDGYHINNQEEKEECVYKIYFNIIEDWFFEEVNNLKQFENPFNIIKIIDSIKTEDFYILILEKCQLSLSDELAQYENKKKPFKINQLFRMIFDLLDGLIQLRTYNIIHCDIKPDNILKKQNGYYCYSDFGTSTKGNDGQFKFKSCTIGYAPQEFILDQKGSFKSDVYSLGLTLEQIINTFTEVNKGVLKQEICLKKIINNFIDIINDKMKKFNHDERLTCEELHKLFFKQMFNLPETSGFEISYIVKHNEIILQSLPYGHHKDFPYFNQTILYYLKLNIKMIKNIIINKQIQNVLKQKSNELETKYHYFLALYLFDAANCYQTIGDYKNSLNNSLESLIIYQQIFKGNNYEKALCLSKVAHSYLKFKEKQKTQKYMNKSIEMFQQVCDRDDSELGQILNNVGCYYQHFNDHRNAIKYFLQSLVVQKNDQNGDQMDLSITLTNIGLSYSQLCEYKISLRYSLEAYLMQKQLVYGNDESLVNSLSNIGNNFILLHQEQKGIKYSLKALEMRKKLFGENHPSISISLCVIGRFYQQTCDYQTSLKYFLKSQEIIKQFYGDFSQDMMVILLNICNVYYDIDDFSNFMKCFIKYYQIYLYLQEKDESRLKFYLEKIFKKYLQLDNKENSSFFYCLYLNPKFLPTNQIKEKLIKIYNQI